ncbi:hypothetical protein HPULCUR_010777 [Helicostylum pulchrum]|uniref:DUF1279 domain-containing protein n=1 Tax=Helicostylum pulchrum TaxID=562976 RepID=A0ABP9YE77_9FUNG
MSQLIKRIAIGRPNYIKSSLFVNRPICRTVTTSSPPKQPSKTKQFMKKYGYVGIGVYLALGLVDLSATMGFITLKGAHRVREVEDYVIGKAKGILGMEHTPLDATKGTDKPSLTSLFFIAYGIHKTILLPFRLSLTAAITPAVAKRLQKLGWVKNISNKKN